MQFNSPYSRNTSILPPGLPPEPSPGLRDHQRPPLPVSDGAVPAVPDVRGVHLAAGDGQGDAGDLRAADQGAPTEGNEVFVLRGWSQVSRWRFYLN